MPWAALCLTKRVVPFIKHAVQDVLTYLSVHQTKEKEIMKNKLIIATLLTLSPLGLAMAAPNNVGCGVGTNIFDGESLESLASLSGVDDAHKAAFFATTKAHFAAIIPSDRANTQDVIAGLNKVLAENADLAQYARLV